MKPEEDGARAWVNISHPSQATSGHAISTIRSHIGKYYRNRATPEQREQLFKTSKCSPQQQKPWVAGTVLRLGNRHGTFGPEPCPKGQNDRGIKKQKDRQIVFSAATNKVPKGGAKQKGIQTLRKFSPDDEDANKTTSQDGASGRNDLPMVAFEMTSEHFYAIYNEHQSPKPVPLRGADAIDPFRTSTLSKHPNSFTLLRFYQDWTPTHQTDVDLNDELLLLPLLAYNATLMTTLNLTSEKDPTVHNLTGRALHLVRRSLQTPSRIQISPISSGLAFLMMCSLFQADHEAAQAHLKGLKALLGHFGHSFGDLPLSVQQMIIYCDIAARAPTLSRPIFNTVVQEYQVKERTALPDGPFRLARDRLKKLSLAYKDDLSRHILDLIMLLLDNFDDAIARNLREETYAAQIMYYRVYVALVDLDEIRSVHYYIIEWRKKQLLQILWRIALLIPIRHEYSALFDRSIEMLESVFELEEGTQHVSGNTPTNPNSPRSRQNVSRRYPHFLGHDEPSNMNDLLLGYADTHAEMLKMEKVPSGNVSLSLRRKVYGPLFLYNPVTPRS
ncbi:hypothetical protein H2204_001425 [Knufia peltigerae]|uniref:Uncharacterized protein n=1 Tax=Knufia peltigerae TaxID=1002370 RepID=A0AA38YDG6_9EURO|nr:hypothetical protein H2204_001425 [Knufia peltigerae]